jgi:menaquinone-specific isochorismate synthase
MEQARSDERSRVAGREDAVLVSRSRAVPDVSFRAVLAQQGSPRVHWTAPDGLEIVGSGAATRLRAGGPDRFDQLRAGAADIFADADTPDDEARPRLFGGLAFADDHEPAPPWEGFPAAEFVLPAIQVTRTEAGTRLTVSAYDADTDLAAVEERLDAVHDDLASLPMLSPAGDPPGVLASERTTTEAEWTAQVESAVERIAEGDLQKVVLAVALAVTLEQPVTVPDVLERLRRSYPDCYRFLVEPTAEAGFFGAPPERLVRLDDRHVQTEALAGSVPRGDTPEEDARHARSLLESEKLQHEQGLVADTIAEQLAPFGAVSTGSQRVRKLATIQHLATPITADLDAAEHVLSIVEALHPTPAVGGLPPATALEVIRETESFERGWYASPVGWFDADGDGEFAVGIRSAVAGGRRATLFAGNGIVGDSDPAEEWDEIHLKYRPILDELESR